MLSTINGGGHGQFYALLTIVCATKNNHFLIEDKYSGLIFQHALTNILNISQNFIKLPRKLMKPHELISQFTNRQKGNKVSYDSIDYFIYQFKEDKGARVLDLPRHLAASRHMYSSPASGEVQIDGGKAGTARVPPIPQGGQMEASPIGRRSH